MAGKKNARSSKTDHVLSLLSGGTRPGPQSELVSQPQEEQTKSTIEQSKIQPEPEAQSQLETTQSPAAGKKPARTRKKTASVPKDVTREAESTPKEAELDVKGAETTSKEAELDAKGAESASEEAELNAEGIGATTKEHAAQTAHAARRTGERLTTPILQVARTNNEALSESIRDALNQALEEELTQQIQEEKLAEPQLQPIYQPDDLLEPEPVPQSLFQPITQPEVIPQPEAIHQPESAARMEPEAPFLPHQVVLPDGAVCVNVMELLVDERLDRYVRMFGLCTCPRCLADVRALALTQLPAKYVVLSPQTATPMLSFYQAKFESMVIAQVIHACKTVMEFPRHIV